MKFVLKTIFTLLAFMILAVSCSGQGKSKGDTMNNKKVLVVFFSHAGDNYSVGNIKEGNTKIVVDYIKEIVPCDVFEIVAEKSYDMPYKALTELAQKEKQSGEKPAFKGAVNNIEAYETVIIGGPIWWGTYPQVMFSFFDKYDLNGKTIAPFTTHEGSGLGSTVNDLKRKYPKADVKQGFAIYGHDVRSGKDKVTAWLKSLGY